MCVPKGTPPNACIPEKMPCVSIKPVLEAKRLGRAAVNHYWLLWVQAAGLPCCPPHTLNAGLPREGAQISSSEGWWF